MRMKKNYIGVDLADADLTYVDWIGANLTGANLTCANLTSANLREADLTGANLTMAYLREANLTGANLTGATLAGETLAATTLGNATVCPFVKLNGRLSFFIKDDKDNKIVACGCWLSTLADFEVRCKAVYPNQPEEAYFSQIQYLKTI